MMSLNGLPEFCLTAFMLMTSKQLLSQLILYLLVAVRDFSPHPRHIALVKQLIYFKSKMEMLCSLMRQC